MNSENNDRRAPQRDPGTPIYDQLADKLTTPAELTPASAAAVEATVPEPHATGELVAATVVLELFGRMKDIEDGDGGWNGGDTVDALCEWFAQFGINVDADQLAAAQALRVPAWLARTLTEPSSDES